MIKSTISSSDARVVSFYNSVSNKPRNSSGYFIGSVQNSTGLLYVINPSNPTIHVWFPPELEEYSNASAGTSGDRLGGVRLSGFESIEQAAEFIKQVFSSPDEVAKFINASAQDNIGSTYGIKRKARRKIKQPVAKTIASDLDVPARGRLYDFFKRDDVVAIARRMGGADVFQASLEGLTIKSFADKHALAFK